MIREGRLGKEIDDEVACFVASTGFDINILAIDLFNDMAHVIMLSEKEIISKAEAGKILAGLKKIYDSIDEIKIEGEEDVHIAIEDMLTDQIGDVAGKMHTARSRNDQIACDLRILLRAEVNNISSLLMEFISILLEKAADHVDTIMPGYSHLQKGQPTTLGHHLVAHADGVLRDLGRLEDAYARINLNPLGAGALATSSFPVDRKRTMQLLGFDGIIENSMDAVASRDFILEMHSCLSLLMANITRIAEEIILWTTSEFGFAELSDEMASTSSIMPQKKNPDALELIRARSGRVFGNLVSSLSIVKALPMSYNRDLQELNPIVMNSIRTTKDSLVIIGNAVKELDIDKQRMMDACVKDFVTATDLADMIVKEKKIPFRKAHQVVGALVARALENGISMEGIDSKMLDDIAEGTIGTTLGLRNDSIETALSPDVAVKSRNVLGGPAPTEVKRMITSRKHDLVGKQGDLNSKVKKIENAKKLLLSTVDKMT